MGDPVKWLAAKQKTKEIMVRFDNDN